MKFPADTQLSTIAIKKTHDTTLVITSISVKSTPIIANQQSGQLFEFWKGSYTATKAQLLHPLTRQTTADRTRIEFEEASITSPWS